MTQGVTVCTCESCGSTWFPARYWCPQCGASELANREVDTGVVEEVTALRRSADRPGAAPVRLGVVRLEGGERLVARLEPGVAAGERARLAGRDGAPVALPA
jgi:uncharacterized OB-fold protein